MSDRQDEKLDTMLRSRGIEASSADLAERIILRARSKPQNRTMPLFQSIKQLFTEFHLRRPAYLLAATLILGFVVGFNTPVETAGDSSSTLRAQTFLDADVEVL